MAKKKEDYRKEKMAVKYKRFRDTLKNICDEFGIPHDEILQKYPEDAFMHYTDIELSTFVNSMNELLGEILKKCCFEMWAELISESFDEKHQKSISELVMAMVKSDAANAYAKMSLAADFLLRLNDESKKDSALNSLRAYCSSHSIEEMENNYSIARYSKHRVDVNRACKEGFAKNPKVNRGYVEALFHASSKAEKEAIQAERCAE